MSTKDPPPATRQTLPGRCDAPTPSARPRTNWLLLLNAMLGTFLSGMASRIFNIALPTLARSLGTDFVGISWAYMSYQLSNIGLSLVFGKVGDLYGKEKIFGIGAAVFAAGALLCGLAWNVGQLIFFRLVQGVGAAMIQSMARALGAEALPEELSGRAQSYMTAAFHTGFLLGPSFGGLIIDYISWRWTFFLLVPVAAAGAVLSLFNARRAQSEAPEAPIDYLGALLLIAASTLLILVMDRRAAALLGGARGMVGIGAFGCLLALVYHERRVSSPIINLELFKIRMFSFSTASLFFVALCYMFANFLLPFYLEEILLLSPSFIGLMFVVPPVLTILLTPLSGHLSDRVGPRWPSSAGVAFLAASLLAGYLFEANSSWLLPTAMLALNGVANGLFNTANSVGIINSVPRADRGSASGMLHVMFGIGNVSGIALASFSMSAAVVGLGAGAQAGLSPTANPAGFVAALNTTFLVAAAVCGVAFVTSMVRGPKAQPTRT